MQALSNTQDKGGRTGMALYNNKGKFLASDAMPPTAATATATTSP